MTEQITLRQIKDLPAIGGLTTITQQVNFGTQEDQIVSITVSAPFVTASTKFIVQPEFTTTPDHDPEDYALEGVQAGITNIVAGEGFDLIASCRDSTYGRYNFQIQY